jgi:phosphotransacetylase/acyl dehydratase
MLIKSLTLDEINVGDCAQVRRLITQDDLYVFATSSGNFNPLHLAVNEREDKQVIEPVAPGMFVASMISAVLGNQLPGAGALYRKQELNFLDRARAGEELICRVRVTEKLADGALLLSTQVERVSDGALILSGFAEVLPTPTKIDLKEIEVPGLIVQRHRHFEALLKRAKPLPAILTAVVCPHDDNSLEGALLATREGIITPILIGDADKIRATASSLNEDISGFELIDVPSSAEAASVKACSLVREGRVAAVMKGHMHTDDLLKPMLDKINGLRVGRRFTHVFVMDVPGLPEPLMVTDAAINIAPDLLTKIDICQNAIDLARSLGMQARVGVISAVETVNPAIQSSIDAALLSKMADRGQIRGGLVEGPLAMDNAVDIGAARTKGLRGEVAGRANILVVPGLDAGNMLAKQLSFVSHAEGAGLVLGARVPVILNSRSDSPMSRLASCAVAALHAAHIAEEASA